MIPKLGVWLGDLANPNESATFVGTSSYGQTDQNFKR